MKFIYIFVNVPYIWKCKIGISNNVKSRRKNVSKTTPGVVLPVWAVFIPFAEKLEQQLHRFFHTFKSPFHKGSGRSEWFFTLPVLPIAWLLLNFMFLVYWSPVWLLFYWYFYL